MGLWNAAHPTRGSPFSTLCQLGWSSRPVGASLTVVGLRNATVPLPPPRPTTHYPQPAQPHYFLPASAAHSSATCSNLFQSWRTGGSGVGGGQVESLVAGALLCWLLLLVDRA